MTDKGRCCGYLHIAHSNPKSGLPPMEKLYGRLSLPQIPALRFGQRSLPKCRDCGGKLQLLETYPDSGRHL
ncbi:MAG: hypothetical protein AB7U05_12700 [Mangrovibacterium sp.]